jgi:integrase
MSMSIKVVFIKQSPSDEFGYVFIRTIEGKIQKKKSLKIKIKKKDWDTYFNPNTQRFREDKRFSNSKIYNTYIERTLQELQGVKNDLSLVSDDKKSLLDYWEFCLKNTKNHGTIIKHKGVISKLKKFLATKKITNLYFSEITPIFIRELKHYLETTKDPKLLSQNSVNHYLKIIKSIINKSTEDDYYTYVKHPFNTIVLKKEKLAKRVLNDEDLNVLIKAEIKSPDLNDTRDMFLFQLFSNGMRVSDLLLLRWGNISVSDHRINYTMFKTGTPISLPVSLNLATILSKRLGSYGNLEKLYNLTSIDFSTSYQKPSPFGKNIVLSYTIKMFDDVISKKVVKNEGITKNVTNQKSDGYHTGFSGSSETSISRMDRTDRVIKYKGYKIWEEDYEIKRVIDKREELVHQIQKMFIHSVMGKVNKEAKKDFIFPYLSKELFKNEVVKNRDIDLEQYKNLKHTTIVYNRKLKRLQQECRIETNLTSHVPRHSFTNILLKMNGVNLYDISQSLGHTNLKTTENYIMGGFNVEKIDYLSKEISTKYNLTDK